MLEELYLNGNQLGTSTCKNIGLVLSECNLMHKNLLNNFLSKNQVN
jgi:hypothetical protein